MNKLTILDLFAGCGGLSAGFESDMFDIKVANEFWYDGAKTYTNNHPNTNVICDDITKDEVKNEIYESFEKVACDIIIGGPPCQAYSNAGKRNPNDSRGRLFEDYVKIVQKLKPKMFIMENVKGLLTMKHYKGNLTKDEEIIKKEIINLEIKRRELLDQRIKHKNNSSKFAFSETDIQELEQTKVRLTELKKYQDVVKVFVLDEILNRLSSIGYNTQFKLLNSANYGVPQKRERIIIVGTRSDIRTKFTYPKPTHFEKTSSNELFEQKKWKTVREAISDLELLNQNDDYMHIFTKHSKEFLTKIDSTKIGQSVFGNYSDAFFRSYPDEPSRTVKENHGGVFVHYEFNRVMTPRELARLQSFPDDYKFFGSKSSILKQIGNAVPVGLSKAIANQVTDFFEQNFV